MAKQVIKKVTDKQIEQALIKSFGIINRTLEYLKDKYNIEISRQAIYQRVKKSPKLQEVQEEARETIVDLCEDTIVEAIKQGDSRLAFQVICKLGKDRGYTDNDFNIRTLSDENKIIFDIPNIEVSGKEQMEDE